MVWIMNEPDTYRKFLGMWMSAKMLMTAIIGVVLFVVLNSGYRMEIKNAKRWKYANDNHIHHWRYYDDMFLCVEHNCKSVIQHYKDRWIVLRNHRGDILRKYIR